MLNTNERMHISIEVNDDKELLAIGNNIHEQLRGNKDYIDNNIIISIDSPSIINISISKECKDIPSIII